jgi:hypothetical protein
MSLEDKLNPETCQFTGARLWNACRTELTIYINLQACTQLYVRHNSTHEADYLCEKHLHLEVYTNSRDRGKRTSGECFKRAISICFMSV